MWHIPFLDQWLHLPQERSATVPATATLSATSALVVLGGRVLFAGIFLVSGFNHFLSHTEMVAYAASNGVPLPELMVPLTGLMILAGGLSVLLGYYARAGGLLLFLFLVPTAFIMHRFWDVGDPAMSAVQMAHFMKNLSMAGGALLLTVFGAGPLSLDEEA